MNLVESIGYIASALVLAAFCMRDMVALRVMAIMSNVAFVGYAALAGLQPVLMLHVLLLPMNIWRLVEMAKKAASSDRDAPTDTMRSGQDQEQDEKAFHGRVRT